MKTLLASLLFLSAGAFAHEEKVAFLLSRYGNQKQTCTIWNTDSGLKAQGQNFYNDQPISTKTELLSDTTGFVKLSKKILGAHYEEGPAGSSDALYIMSVAGIVNGEEMETPIFATGERNLESTEPLAMDFFYDVNFYCRNVLVNAKETFSN